MKIRKYSIVMVILALASLAASYSETTQKNIDFVQASLAGDIQAMESLMKQGAGVNAPYGDQGEPTALMLAAERGDMKTALFLLANKANINHRDGAGNTPLMYAARGGSMEMLILLVKNGAQMNLDNGIGSTALEVASVNGRQEMVKFFMEKDARYGMELAIAAAARYGHSGIVKMFLAAHAPVTMKDREGYTALYHAVNGGYVDTAEVLIKGGSDVNMTQKDNETPLMASVKNGDLAMTKYLISAGAKSDMRNYDGRTPVLEAARTNMLEMAELFPAGTTNWNDRDYQQNSPLIFLALLDEKPDTRIAEFLLSRGADIHHKNREGKTALIIASARGHLDLVKLLVDKGADITVRDRSNRDALSWAAQSGHGEIADLLVKKGAKPQTVKPAPAKKEGHGASVRNERFFTAIALGNRSVVSYELKKGMDPNIRHRDGSTPLIKTVRAGLPEKISLETMKLLIKKDADPNLADAAGMTPLDHAADLNRRELAAYLMDKGAERRGLRLFTFAVRSGDRELMNYLIEDKKIDPTEALFTPLDHEAVKALISAGADVNIRDREGRTPLVALCQRATRWSFYNNSAVIDELLKSGADVNAKDAKGRTSLAIARSWGNKKLVELLVKNGGK